MSQRIEATVSNKKVVVFFDICDGKRGRCFYCSKPGGRSQDVKISGIQRKKVGKEIKVLLWRKRITVFVYQKLFHKRKVCESKSCQGKYFEGKKEAYGILW